MNQIPERVTEGFSDWLTYSPHPLAQDWRKHRTPGGLGSFLGMLLILVFGYFVFVAPYHLYGSVRDLAIRQLWPDRVQIVSGDEVVKQFYTYTPILTTENYLTQHHYGYAPIYSKGVYPKHTWSTYWFGKPANTEANRIVFTNGGPYATVLIDYGDGTIHDLNLGRTERNSPFHLWRFTQKGDLGWASNMPPRPYFR